MYILLLLLLTLAGNARKPIRRRYLRMFANYVETPNYKVKWFTTGFL